MFQLAGQIFFGLIIGTLAKLVMPEAEPGGVMLTALIGLAGSTIGTFIGHIVFGSHHFIGWILSIAGAIAILCIYRAVVRRRTDGESTATRT